MAFTLSGVEQFAELPTATVTSGGTDAPSAGTSENWTLSGSSLPAADSSGTPPTGFYVGDPAADAEIILVTNISGSTATVTRGALGTTPVTHTAGFTIIQVVAGESLGTVTPSWLDVYRQFGADPTGTNASDSALSAAFSALGGDSGIIRIPSVPGSGATYKISTGWAMAQGSAQRVILLCDPGVTFSYHGSGSCISAYSTDVDGGTNGLEIIGSPVIDGSNASAGAVGLEIGDMFRPCIPDDVWIQNFTGTGSKGLWLNNRYSYTEQARIRAFVSNCTTHAQLDVNGGTESFDRCDLDLCINQGAASQNGVVFNAGAQIYSGAVKIRGNFLTSDSALTSAVLMLTGDTGGFYSSILNSQLDIGVECDGADTYGPYTVYYGSASNVIQGCYGNMEFLPATTAFTGSNITSGDQISEWWGPVSDGNITNYTPVSWNSSGDMFTGNIGAYGYVALAATGTAPTGFSEQATFYANETTYQASAVNPQGLATTLRGTLASGTITLADSTAATAIASGSVPANDPVAGAVYRLRSWILASDTSAPTLTFYVTWGSGTLLSGSAVTLGSSVSNMPFYFETEAQFTSGTTCAGFLRGQYGTATLAWSTTPTSVLDGWTPATVSTSAGEFFAIEAKWSAASASNTLTSYYTAERIA